MLEVIKAVNDSLHQINIKVGISSSITNLQLYLRSNINNAGFILTGWIIQTIRYCISLPKIKWLHWLKENKTQCQRLILNYISGSTRGAPSSWIPGLSRIFLSVDGEQDWNTYLQKQAAAQTSSVVREPTHLLQAVQWEVRDQLPVQIQPGHRQPWHV